MYHPKLQSVSSAGVYVRICVCLLQPEPQSRSFIICFQLRFDSLHEQAIHICTRATTRQSHTIYLYCYTHSPQTVAVITMIKVFQLQATQSAVQFKHSKKISRQVNALPIYLVSVILTDNYSFLFLSIEQKVCANRIETINYN